MNITIEAGKLDPHLIQQRNDGESVGEINGHLPLEGLGDFRPHGLQLLFGLIGDRIRLHFDSFVVRDGFDLVAQDRVDLSRCISLLSCVCHGGCFGFMLPGCLSQIVVGASGGFGKLQCR